MKNVKKIHGTTPTLFKVTHSQPPRGRLRHEREQRGGEESLHDGDISAGGLVDQVQLVNAAQGEELVPGLGADGQTRAVLVEIYEVDIQVWLLHT